MLSWQLTLLWILGNAVVYPIAPLFAIFAGIAVIGGLSIVQWQIIRTIVPSSSKLWAVCTLLALLSYYISGSSSQYNYPIDFSSYSSIIFAIIFVVLTEFAFWRTFGRFSYLSYSVMSGLVVIINQVYVFPYHQVFGSDYNQFAQAIVFFTGGIFYGIITVIIIQFFSSNRLSKSDSEVDLRSNV